MERRNRNILLICIAVVIVVAVFSSFGAGLFSGDTAKIVLPTPSESAQPGGETGDPSGEDGLVRVEVTPKTVQSVIAALSRPESYYREVTVRDYWGDEESGVTTAKVWANARWTLVEATGPTGLVRRSLVGEDTVQIWYGDEDGRFTAPADRHSADLEGQRIPTYEDVLELDPTAITATGYEDKGGLNCVYVEAEDSALGYRERYWVSVDSGLLVAAETWDGKTLVYSMSAYELERPVPAGVLPEDGAEEG